MASQPISQSVLCLDGFSALAILETVEPCNDATYQYPKIESPFKRSSESAPQADTGVTLRVGGKTFPLSPAEVRLAQAFQEELKHTHRAMAELREDAAASARKRYLEERDKAVSKSIKQWNRHVTYGYMAAIVLIGLAVAAFIKLARQFGY